MSVATANCELGGRFRKCANSAVNTCQYCGRSFCASHTHHIKDHEAVCARDTCVAKHEDLQRHLDYKREVGGRNGAGHCGEPGCSTVHPRYQCSMCRGAFCAEHVRERMYALQDGYVKIDKRVSICDWCWRRRKIWQKR